MPNFFVQLIKFRLHSVNVWIDTSIEETHDEGTRKWAIGVACEEMAKIKDELRTVGYVTNMGEQVLLGKRCFAEYLRTKKRLDGTLEN